MLLSLQNFSSIVVQLAFWDKVVMNTSLFRSAAPQAC
jgi:hypothetical protein